MQINPVQVSKRAWKYIPRSQENLVKTEWVTATPFTVPGTIITVSYCNLSFKETTKFHSARCKNDSLTDYEKFNTSNTFEMVINNLGIAVLLPWKASGSAVDIAHQRSRLRVYLWSLRWTSETLLRSQELQIDFAEKKTGASSKNKQRNTKRTFEMKTAFNCCTQFARRQKKTLNFFTVDWESDGEPLQATEDVQQVVA